MHIPSEKLIFKFPDKPFFTEVREKIQFNWIKEMTNLEVNWSYVIFSVEKKIIWMIQRASNIIGYEN